MSKAKFLSNASSQNSKETSDILQILKRLDETIALPNNHYNSFSNSDLVQILKEINQITHSGQTSPQYKALIEHDATVRILLVIITKDYVIDDLLAQESSNKSDFGIS